MYRFESKNNCKQEREVLDDTHTHTYILGSTEKNNDDTNGNGVTKKPTTLKQGK